MLLEYPGLFSVILAGRNLGPLEARLIERRVLRICQCREAEAGAAQAARLPAAVTRMERMNRYPSRELNAPFSDK